MSLYQILIPASVKARPCQLPTSSGALGLRRSSKAYTSERVAPSPCLLSDMGEYIQQTKVYVVRCNVQWSEVMLLNTWHFRTVAQRRELSVSLTCWAQGWTYARNKYKSEPSGVDRQRQKYQQTTLWWFSMPICFWEPTTKTTEGKVFATTINHTKDGPLCVSQTWFS